MPSFNTKARDDVLKAIAGQVLGGLYGTMKELRRCIVFLRDGFYPNLSTLVMSVDAHMCQFALYARPLVAEDERLIGRYGISFGNGSQELQEMPQGMGGDISISLIVTIGDKSAWTAEQRQKSEPYSTSLATSPTSETKSTPDSET